MSTELIVLLGGIVTVTGSYFVARLQRPKIKAEAQTFIGDAYKGLIEELRHEVADVREGQAAVKTELAYERKRNYALEQWSKALTAQVIELGGVPVLYSNYKGS